MTEDIELWVRSTHLVVASLRYEDMPPGPRASWRRVGLFVSWPLVMLAAEMRREGKAP